MALLQLYSLRPGCRFEAYYDGDGGFAGLSYVMSHGRLAYVLYLAVDDSVRSRGYGSQILSLIRRRSPESSIVLDIEPVEPGADNYEQRVRRLAFYQRNGLSPTPLMCRDGQGRYAVVSEDPGLGAAELESLYRWFSIGHRAMTVSAVERPGAGA